MPSSLDSRSIVVVRQAGRQPGRQNSSSLYTNILKFTNFNSKARLGYLNGL